MTAGYLALVLHAHLPFVRHPEHEEFLEEDWLFEAITECYLPLIRVMDGWLDDGIDFRLTFTLTPTLCAMLDDELLRQRYIRYIDKLIELAGKEQDRTRLIPAMHEVARFYYDRLRYAKRIYVERYDCDVLSAFKKFQQLGKIELITCAATHGYLPLMMDYPEAVRAQILTGRDSFKERFGYAPQGIWLPECAYVPGLDKFLQEAELRWFILDTHGLMFAEPRPRAGVFAPIFTPSGVAAFARDTESGKQVWSSLEGYPGDPYYRDFYRDLGFEAEYDYIRPYILGNGQRKFTGIKYHRITGRGVEKELYEPLRALERTEVHAGNFHFNRTQQVQYLNGVLGQPPIVISPYDAELFGHWWFEGPEFLDQFVRKCAKEEGGLKLITPSEYLKLSPRQQIAQPAASSWGHKGFWEVWLDNSNSWIYPHLHEAARRMIESAARHRNNTDPLVERCLQQMARELLLAQSSDWAFIMKTGTMVDYAVKRTKDHILRFTRLYEQQKVNLIDERFLERCEWRSNLFPGVNWRYYF